MREALSSFALDASYTAKNSVLNTRPFDLHVLGTPPAFVLSQDQTLKFKLILLALLFLLLLCNLVRCSHLFAAFGGY